MYFKISRVLFATTYFFFLPLKCYYVIFEEILTFGMCWHASFWNQKTDTEFPSTSLRAGKLYGIKREKRKRISFSFVGMRGEQLSYRMLKIFKCFIWLFFPFATYSYPDEKQLYQVMCLLKKITHLGNSKDDQI